MMPNKIAKLIQSRTDDDKWDLYAFEKQQADKAKNHNAIEITFATNFTTKVVFGEYKYGNLRIQCCQMALYGEREESIGLTFRIGKETIDSHGVLMNETSTGVPVNRAGDAVELSVKLQEDFIGWLSGFNALTY